MDENAITSAPSPMAIRWAGLNPYIQGYDGKPLVMPENPTESEGAYCVKEYMLGKRDVANGRKSAYWTPYGVSRHG